MSEGQPLGGPTPPTNVAVNQSNTNQQQANVVQQPAKALDEQAVRDAEVARVARERRKRQGKAKKAEWKPRWVSSRARRLRRHRHVWTASQDAALHPRFRRPHFRH